MQRTFIILAGFLALLACSFPVAAEDAAALPDRILGKERTPVVMEEYVSLTCPHCAEFYLNILPELEKRYVDKGLVRIILHDYPMDGPGLKAATLARCMPASEFYPFIRILYENQMKWATEANPDRILIQYAQLGGLDPGDAKACLNNMSLQNAIIAERNVASDKFGVQSTPTFIFDNGTERLEGTGHIEDFTAVIDRLLAHKK